MTKEQPICLTCRFFQPARLSPEISQGECRRRAPTQHFAFVQPDDWCGEHEVRAPHA